MKANQFSKTEEAVSPVIGVILMVAITVVLAAVVFVLVSNLSDTKDQAPDVGFSRDESTDRINLVSSDSGLLWSQFRITVAVEDLAFNINANSVAATASLAGPGQATPSPLLSTNANGVTAVAAGNFIDLCDDAGGESNNVNIRIVHVETNTQVFETTFATMAACA